MPLAKTRHGCLHYEIVDQVAPWVGPRDAILFHHGIGASSEIWSGWFPALQEAHRLFSFDIRAYGRSHIPADDFASALDVLVDAQGVVRRAAREVAAFINSECIEGAHWDRLVATTEGHRVSDLAVGSRRQPVHSRAGHG